MSSFFPTLHSVHVLITECLLELWTCVPSDILSHKHLRFMISHTKFSIFSSPVQASSPFPVLVKGLKPGCHSWILLFPHSPYQVIHHLGLILSPYCGSNLFISLQRHSSTVATQREVTNRELISNLAPSFILPSPTLNAWKKCQGTKK